MTTKAGVSPQRIAYLLGHTSMNLVYWTSSHLPGEDFSPDLALLPTPSTGIVPPIGSGPPAPPRATGKMPAHAPWLAAASRRSGAVGTDRHAERGFSGILARELGELVAVRASGDGHDGGGRGLALLDSSRQFPEPACGVLAPMASGSGFRLSCQATWRSLWLFQVTLPRPASDLTRSTTPSGRSRALRLT